MGPDRDDIPGRPRAGLSQDIAAHVEATVRAAEQEAERAIEERRRRAEDEVRRYLAAARLHVDAEAAARGARLETLSAAAHRLADELADAAAALHAELRRADDGLRGALPRTPWPAEPPSSAPAAAAERAPATEPPNAARLVAIEMAVGGAARADVERHLRERLGIADPSTLLDDVFGAESHAGSRLAWGEP